MLLGECCDRCDVFEMKFSFQYHSLYFVQMQKSRLALLLTEGIKGRRGRISNKNDSRNKSNVPIRVVTLKSGDEREAGNDTVIQNLELVVNTQSGSIMG